MTPNDTLLESYIGTLFSHYQRSFLLQPMGTNTDNHYHTLHMHAHVRVRAHTHRERDRDREREREREIATLNTK